jgi:hypothetical protein
MSSAEQNSPREKLSQANPSSDQGPLQPPPQRPTLVSPPKRPVKPSPAVEPPPKDKVAQPVSNGASKPAAPADRPLSDIDQSAETMRCQPIAPPSEPMQYRAIGLVRGTYQPTEPDQLNRGTLHTEDGAPIDAVLLGRVTSLVKKHIDLEASHLWVVYPRTRRNDENEDQDLHLQIVGVWEPETLGLPGEPAPNAEAEAEATDKPEGTQAEAESPTEPSMHQATAELPAVSDNYFSIRGEVVRYSPEEELISVKILQGVKRSPAGSKSFKVNLKGTIEGRTVGYFWDFQARRDNQLLIIEEAAVVGIVPPKKRGKKKAGPPRTGRGGGNRPMPARRSMGPRSGSSRPRKIDAGEDLRA